MSTYYDFDKIKEGDELHVQDMVEVLSALPQEANFLLTGDSHVVVHVSEDNKTVCLDTEYLEDSYKEFGDYADIERICPIEIDSSLIEDEEEDDDNE